MAPKGKAAPQLIFHRPESDMDPQVMVTPQHSLSETLRFAEVVYACVKSRGTAHIDWAHVSAEAGMAPAECMRLWRFVAYHWKGPFGYKRSDVEYDQVDLGADSDPEGAITHAVAVAVRGRAKKRSSGAQPGDKRSVLPVGALGFTLFGREHRKQVKEANPNISFGDIAKELGRMWRAMPDKDKAAWVDKAAKSKAAAAEREGKAASKKAGVKAGAGPPAPPAGPRRGSGGAGPSGAVHEP